MGTKNLNVVYQTVSHREAHRLGKRLAPSYHVMSNVHHPINILTQEYGHVPFLSYGGDIFHIFGYMPAT